MKTSIAVLATVFVCVSSLLVSHVSATQLTDGDRQMILHYAAKIVRIALGGDTFNTVPSGVKRNSGMLDAVMNMPDLMRAGKK